MKNCKRRGATLVELGLVSFFSSIVITAAMVLTVGVGRSYDRTSNQYQVDLAASQGIQRITQDFQEAKQFQILSSTWIRISYPVTGPDGSFNRKITDTVNTIDYYRGRPDGTRDSTGTCLVRAPVGSTARSVCDDLNNLQFVSESPSSIAVDVSVRKVTPSKTYTCAMNHRAILMRNYNQ